MDAPKQAFYHSPIGLIRIEAVDEAVTGLDFMDQESPTSARLPGVLRDALRQIEEYFLGRRTKFTLALRPAGTPFQRDVWKALVRIPYGQTASYKDIAAAVGRPAAARAVGAANGANPISLLIPCHRVLGADGRLTGYGGGLWRKEWLLRHERGGRPLFG
ncbi:MAG: methylated-DNA--[protein]-cysteine S-methyltransferase [Candidatus Aminicenantes bacterium]|nr:methylated-DNA--[protein]-cysteine S-methyltransferase [Candidatus Aminicenantes bacterium]